MLRDLRYALRSLAKSPGFVLVAALCLGLALALNTTTFAILDGMLHPSLPVKDADRLFEIRMWGWGWARQTRGPSWWERYSLLRDARFYQDIAFYELGLQMTTVRAGNEVNEQWVPRVSRNLFPMLGARPELGRVIEHGSPDDVALVSHDVWEQAFGGRSLSGVTIWVGDREYRVIGVLPPEMTYPLGWAGGIWVPVPVASEQTGSGLGRISPVVKLRPGTWAAVNQQLGALAHRLVEDYGSVGPNPYAFSLWSIVPQAEELQRIHFALAGAVFVVLLIACVNLANLMLVRGVAKRRELALRMAIGADRATVVKHVFTESVVIAGAGAALGLVLTLWAVALLHNQMPPSVAMLGATRPQLSWRVFAAGLGLAAATLGIFGLWPAVRVSDVNVSEPLKDNSPSAIGRRRSRYSPLVIAEVSLSLVLLMGAVLLVKAAEHASNLNLGYDPTGLLGASVWMGPEARADSVKTVSHDVVARARGLPGVLAAAAYDMLGGGGAAMSGAYDGTNGLVTLRSLVWAGDGYLRTLGLPVVAGRDLLPGDERNGVVVVDEDAARALWPDARAVGRLIKLGGPKSTDPWRLVVGVTRSTKSARPRHDPFGGGDPFLLRRGAVYVAWEPGAGTRSFSLAIRTTKLDAVAAVALRQAIRDVLPSGSRLVVTPWMYYVDLQVRARRFLVGVFGWFSGFALLLAAIGLYGVVSYSASQRMREFAVRIAVGAPARDMVKLVAYDAAVMILAGTGLGAFLAMWSSQFLGDWLGDVYHTDAVSLVVAEAVLLLAGLAAGLEPALRAMRANPVEILRAI